MGIDSESDVTTNLQIGPTSMGMVRIFVEGNGVALPMDFAPEEAEEIAEEIRAAAGRARGDERGRDHPAHPRVADRFTLRNDETRFKPRAVGLEPNRPPPERF